MTDRITGADLIAALAEQYDFDKTAAETLAELDEDDIANLDDETLSYLIEAAEAEIAEAYGHGGVEKTASEAIGELSDEELAEALSEMDEDEVVALLGQVELEEAEHTKVASLMSGAFDEDALAGQVWGTAAGEAMADTLAKFANESDGDDDWYEVDPAQMSADEFFAGIESGDIVEIDDDYDHEKVAGLEDIDLTQVSAADLLAYLAEEEELEKEAAMGKVRRYGVAAGRLRSAMGAGADKARSAGSAYMGAVKNVEGRAGAASARNARSALKGKRLSKRWRSNFESQLSSGRSAARKGLAKQVVSIGGPAGAVAGLSVPAARYMRRNDRTHAGA